MFDLSVECPEGDPTGFQQHASRRKTSGPILTFASQSGLRWSECQNQSARQFLPLRTISAVMQFRRRFALQIFQRNFMAPFAKPSPTLASAISPGTDAHPHASTPPHAANAALPTTALRFIRLTRGQRDGRGWAIDEDITGSLP